MYHSIYIPQIWGDPWYRELSCGLTNHILPRDILKLSHCHYHSVILLGNITTLWSYFLNIYKPTSIQGNHNDQYTFYTTFPLHTS